MKAFELVKGLCLTQGNPPSLKLCSFAVTFETNIVTITQLNVTIAVFAGQVCGNGARRSEPLRVGCEHPPGQLRLLRRPPPHAGVLFGCGEREHRPHQVPAAAENAAAVRPTAGPRGGVNVVLVCC